MRDACNHCGTVDFLQGGYCARCRSFLGATGQLGSFSSNSAKCPACNGTGEQWGSSLKCSSCNGTGLR